MELYNCEIGYKYRVKKTPNVSILNTLGVYEGGILTKKDKYNLGGPVLLEISGREIAIGKDLALLIQVEACQ